MELVEIADTIRASRILRQFLEAVTAEGEIHIPHLIARKEAMPILTVLSMRSMPRLMIMDE